jgi:hypothetical protein
LKKQKRIKKFLPTVTNEIDPKDIPVSDRGHWFEKISDGVGFTQFSSHPYRSKQRFAKNDAGAWVRVESPTLKMAAKRTYKAPPVASNDEYRAVLTGRLPTTTDAKWAAEGLPIDVEFKNERIAGYLWQVAADFAAVYEAANIESCALSERRIYARQVCQFLRFRLMHLWRPLVDATVFGRTMADIGRDFGGNKEDSAKLGRQKVIDGLLLARECFWDLNDLNSKIESASRSDEPMCENVVVTLGRKSRDLPNSWHRAANDNRKSIADVA